MFENPAPIPTVFVVFGATGDLMEKKIAPALFRLHIHGRLPKLFQGIGISRRDLTDESFQAYLLNILKSMPEGASLEPEIQAFVSLFHYKKAEFTDSSLYTHLSQEFGRIDGAWNECSNKLFYLAVPPAHYDEICENIGKSGLHLPCSAESGYTRVLIEKPFGHDTESALTLQETLSKIFKEEQIYRLDHYLGKPMLQNMLAFRFSNNFFEGAWSNKYVSRIDIKILETNDVSSRGNFYDALGALRDVGQNHLLSFLSVVTMEKPNVFNSDSVRAARAQMLSTINTPLNLSLDTYRGQYDGYVGTEGVTPNSQTETYFRVRLFSDHPNWRGVPIYLEAGKAMKEDKKEVVVTFKKTSPFFVDEKTSNARNKMLFKLTPQESIQLDMWAKKDGYEMTVEEKRFLLNERDGTKHIQYTEEYEKLLLDAFLGDQTFFTSKEEVCEMWRIIDPIVCGWSDNKNKLNTYTKGTDSVRDQAKKFLNEVTLHTDLLREIGVIGLGKMGGNLCRNLVTHGWNVYGTNRSKEKTLALLKYGIVGKDNVKDLVGAISSPKLIWVMLPHGEATDMAIKELEALLSPHDIVINGGNCHYTDSVRYAQSLNLKQIEYIDVGVSGGPHGALNGASLMVGGNRKLFEHLLPLFVDIATEGGVAHFEGVGAGHFVKMVHNGIEYGMMQAISEGFDLLSKSKYRIPLKTAVDVYRNGSVISSQLLDFLSDAFSKYGENLANVDSKVDMTGEGEWALNEAQIVGSTDWVIKAAKDFRDYSQQNESFTGKVLSAIRGQFGGHPVTTSEKS